MAVRFASARGKRYVLRHLEIVFYVRASSASIIFSRAAKVASLAIACCKLGKLLSHHGMASCIGDMTRMRRLPELSAWQRLSRIYI